MRRRSDRAVLALAGHRSDVVLSGVGAPVFAAARLAACLVLTRRGQVSPFIDLAAIRRAGGDYLAGRSANTRQQIRRSDQFYERDGPIRLERAGSVESGSCDAGSNGRAASGGLGGARQARKFFRAVFRRFHHALIEAGIPRGEIALLKVLSGETTIGFLYNFVWKGRMSAYQSGFAYRGDGGAGKTWHDVPLRGDPCRIGSRA